MFLQLFIFKLQVIQNLANFIQLVIQSLDAVSNFLDFNSMIGMAIFPTFQRRDSFFQSDHTILQLHNHHAHMDTTELAGIALKGVLVVICRDRRICVAHCTGAGLIGKDLIALCLEDGVSIRVDVLTKSLTQSEGNLAGCCDFSGYSLAVALVPGGSALQIVAVGHSATWFITSDCANLSVAADGTGIVAILLGAACSGSNTACEDSTTDCAGVVAVFNPAIIVANHTAGNFVGANRATVVTLNDLAGAGVSISNAGTGLCTSDGAGIVTVFDRSGVSGDNASSILFSVEVAALQTQVLHLGVLASHAKHAHKIFRITGVIQAADGVSQAVELTLIRCSGNATATGVFAPADRGPGAEGAAVTAEGAVGIQNAGVDHDVGGQLGLGF